jgi:hypothetical protein
MHQLEGDGRIFRGGAINGLSRAIARPKFNYFILYRYLDNILLNAILYILAIAIFFQYIVK